MASTEQSVTFEESVETLDEIDARALSECMTVVSVPETPGFYQVASSSGSTYTVDARDRSCTCRDFEYRGDQRECKHLRRVDFATGKRVIPRWVNDEDVDDFLGVAVSGPIFAPEHSD